MDVGDFGGVDDGLYATFCELNGKEKSKKGLFKMFFILKQTSLNRSNIFIIIHSNHSSLP